MLQCYFWHSSLIRQDQTWLISVNISRVLRNCFKLLILMLMAKISYFYLILLSIYFLLTIYLWASTTCFFFLLNQNCEHNWEIDLVHPKPSCLTSFLPYRTCVTTEEMNLEKERRRNVKHNSSTHRSEIFLWQYFMFPLKILLSRNISSIRVFLSVLIKLTYACVTFLLNYSCHLCIFKIVIQYFFKHWEIIRKLTIKSKHRNAWRLSLISVWEKR